MGFSEGVVLGSALPDRLPAAIFRTTNVAVKQKSSMLQLTPLFLKPFSASRFLLV